MWVKIGLCIERLNTKHTNPEMSEIVKRKKLGLAFRNEETFWLAPKSKDVTHNTKAAF